MQRIHATESAQGKTATLPTLLRHYGANAPSSKIKGLMVAGSPEM
jgi:hypothetical protein